MSFTPITVTATRRNADNTPATGNITFTLNAEMTNGTESVQPAPITGVLNDLGELVGQNQEALILLANNDVGTTPASPSASYLVTERVFGSELVSYSVILTHTTTPVDLSTLARYEPAPEVITYIPFTLNPAQTNGQVPIWNATDKRWEPGAGGGGGSPWTFSGEGTPNGRTAFVLSGTELSLPVVIIEGVIDTFYYTPIATGVPITFTIAPGSYATQQEIMSALDNAVGSDSSLFSSHVITNGYQVTSNFTRTKLMLYATGAVGTANNGDTLTAGPTDALGILGFASPSTFAGGQVGVTGIFPDTYQDTLTNAVYVYTNTFAGTSAWVGVLGVFDQPAFTTSLMAQAGPNGDFARTTPWVEFGSSGVFYTQWNDDGSLLMPQPSNASIYGSWGVPTRTPNYTPALDFDARTGLWYWWNSSGPAWVAAVVGGGGSFPTFTGSGSPEGVQTATVFGQTYQDTSIGNLWQYQGTPPSNTGWMQLIGDGSNQAGLYINETLTQLETQDQGAAFGVETAPSGRDNFEHYLNNDHYWETFAYHGDPNGNIAADGKGDFCVDVDTPALYQAGAADDSHWVQLGGSFAPPDSHTATAAFGAVALGTPIQNTLGYDVIVNLAIPVTASTGGSLNSGVGPSATPTVDAITPALAAATVVYVSQYVPDGYYLSVTSTGTITLGTVITQVTSV
jgi:hypothetical protein